MLRSQLVLLVVRNPLFARLIYGHERGRWRVTRLLRLGTRFSPFPVHELLLGSSLHSHEEVLGRRLARRIESRRAERMAVALVSYGSYLAERWLYQSSACITVRACFYLLSLVQRF